VLGDALFLMLAVNAGLLWPLAYKKKRAEIDSILGKINLKIGELINMVPFIKKLEA
jgi:hypothetical protein